MNEQILIWVPVALIVILAVVVLTRRGGMEQFKGRFKSFDWMTYFTVIFGFYVLTSSISDMGVDIPIYWPAIVIIILLLILVILVIYNIRRGKKAGRVVSDERITMISAKSSRNALFITYLVMFIYTMIQDDIPIDAKAMTITLGCGLFALVASAVFYYYQKS